MAQFVAAWKVFLSGSPSWKKEPAARKEFLEWTEPRPMPGEVQYGEVIRWLSDRLPEDAIIAGGAGNFAGWLHRHFRYKGFRTARLDQRLDGLRLSGRGGRQARTAAAHRVRALRRRRLPHDRAGDRHRRAVRRNFVAVVVNNGLYGTIRMHQERSTRAASMGTELRNPDFAAYARAFGGHGETVERTADFAPAFERAAASGKPAIIELDRPGRDHAGDDAQRNPGKSLRSKQ